MQYTVAWRKKRLEKSKIETYLGFCVRAKKIVYGVDEVEKQKRGVYLLIFDASLGQNSLKVMRKAQETLGCPLVESNAGTLGERLHRLGVKAVAIKDKNLADAIVNSMASEPQFKFYFGGTD